MSDALDYLLKVRPDAMGHYFSFMREAGRHLDPKTRALISVITKVHAQTEAGFRQYLRRALKEGAKPMEIIDALLMAFPALGLTRIVWAVDVLLRMDLPEFRLEAVAPGDAKVAPDPLPFWHRLASLDELDAQPTMRIEADGRALFVHRARDGVRVYDAHCPHQGTLLPPEALQGTRLTCPLHRWEFDIEDGRCVRGTKPLRSFLTRIDGRVVLAYW